MDRIKKAAILTRLIDELSKKNSWCGETHVQKAAFFMQELTKVPMDFKFIMYKHGPFSFDLRDEITSLRADDFLKLEPKWPGTRLCPTERCKYIQGLYPKTLDKYKQKIEFVATQIGDKSTGELECLATAFYFSNVLNGQVPDDESPEKMTASKRHISLEQAKKAIKNVANMVRAHEETDSEVQK